MKIVLSFVLLHFFFCLWGLGFSTLLTYRTPYFKYAPAVSVIAWPSCIIFALSGGGHLLARTTFANTQFLIWLGPVTAALAAPWLARRWREIDWRTCTLVSVLAIIAGILPIAPLVAHNDFGYFEFLNGEFVNYAQLAAHTLGLQHSSIPVPWEESHAKIRDGVDFINATVTRLTERHPVHIVQLSSGLLRTSYCAGVFLLLFGILRNHSRGAYAASTIAAGFCFSNFDIFHFQASFMAANVAMSQGLFLFLLLVTWRDLELVPLSTAYVMCNTALLVTYPEATTIFKLLEILMVADQVIRRRQYLLLRWWALANLAVVAINPTMVLSKVLFVRSVSQSGAGWNFIADPINDFPSYLDRLAGLEFVYLPVSAIAPRFPMFALAIVFIIAMVISLFQLSIRLNTIALAGVPLGIAAFHVIGSLQQPINFYGAMKIVLWFTWLAPITVAATYLSQGRLLRIAMLACFCLIALVNAAVFVRAMKAQIGLPTFHSETEARAIVSLLGTQSGKVPSVVIDQPDGIPAWYWAHIFDYEGVNFVWLNQTQQSWFARGWLAAFLPQTNIVVPKSITPELSDGLLAARPLLTTWYGPQLRLIVVARPAGLDLPGMPLRGSTGMQTNLYSSPRISLTRLAPTTQP
jgi:hypothetical protein